MKTLHNGQWVIQKNMAMMNDEKYQNILAAS